MAERRMFAKSVVESDTFLDLPISARLLYFDLGMRGDDDGFVDSPRRIMRITGAAEDDLRLLMAKQFLIPFDSGVVVVRHWKIHNYIRNDRYKPTQYQREKSLITEGISGIYDMRLAVGIPDDNQSSTVCLPDGCIIEDRVIEGNKEEDILLPGAVPAPDRQEPPFIEIPLNDGSTYPVYQSDVEQWQGLYPAVDIPVQLRKISGWNDANPQKRKTKRGIRGHINSWLSKEQDKGGSSPPAGQDKANGTPHPDGGVWWNGKQLLGV